MAWTAPKTFNVGDVLTASDMNLFVRDNSNALAGGTLLKRYSGSSQYSITATSYTAVDTTNLRLASFTVLSGCDVHLTAALPRVVAPNGGGTNLSFMRDGTEITGLTPFVVDGDQCVLMKIVDDAASAGSHNYDLCASVNTGTGTIEARSSYRLMLMARNVPAATNT